MKNLKEIEKTASAIYDISTCALSGAVGTLVNINPKVEFLLQKN